MKYKDSEIARRAAHVRRLRSTFVNLFLAVAVAALASSACHAAPASTAPVANMPPNLPQFISGIVTRSADLQYITEQDSEVFAFYRNTPVKGISDPVFLTLIKRPPNTPVARKVWSSFFQVRIQLDATGKWRTLRDYLEANLTNLTIVSIARDAPYDSQYDLYAVGLFDGGIVVGVQMFGVAT